MKPRLRKSNARTMPGLWVCKCWHMAGYGNTPLEAYENCMRWVRLWARVSPDNEYGPGHRHTAT